MLNNKRIEIEKNKNIDFKIVPIDLERIGVGIYHELPDGDGDPSEVHFSFKLQNMDDVEFVARFKTADILDAVIKQLIEARQEVFGTKIYIG